MNFKESMSPTKCLFKFAINTMMHLGKQCHFQTVGHIHPICHWGRIINMTQTMIFLLRKQLLY